MALHRLKQLKSRFRTNSSFHADYVAFMDNLLEKGFAEKVPDDDVAVDEGKCWYIPHHAVYHAKKPGKIRIVFDCSSKFRDQSLNDHLLQGPYLINNLVGVLCRFRQEPVAFICDVEQMFHQFLVNQEHRDFLRFLWWENGEYDSTEPVTFRMRAHLFGAVSSPGCANFGLKQIADDYESKYGSTAANFIRHEFYVDDGLRSVFSGSDAKKLIAESIAMCAEGGLRLHKFVSNSNKVLEFVPAEDRSKIIKNIDLLQDLLPVEAALGVQWCIESDTFKFRIIFQTKPMTRRGILSTVSSIYDPLGFIAPVVLMGKQILRRMCADDCDWDDPLSDKIATDWDRWRHDICSLEQVAIQRSFKPKGFGTVASVSLHHFSDASTVGYGQCTYIQLQNDQNQVHVSLAMGKARVAPLKTVTIPPGLELTAAVVSVRVSTLLRKELEYSNITEVFWTDSNVALAYIKSDSQRFRVFVANRVQQIRDHTEPSQWKHISSEENPADDASRGITVDKFINKSNWLKGPSFLWATELPNNPEEESAVQVDDSELKKVQVFASQTTPQSPLSRLEYFSDWYRAKRAIAVCLRLKANMRAHTVTINPNKAPKTYNPVSTDEIQKAETVIFKLVQDSNFADEMKVLRKRLPTERKSMSGRSPLYRLDPYMDDQGIIRVGGRIKLSQLEPREKHPIVLPRKHHVTDLVIRYYHEKAAHQGRNMTLNAIRSGGVWIIGCCSAVSYLMSRCVTCRRLRSAVQEQKMADLPQDRVTSAPPFSYYGVDYFGPWIIKEGRKHMKRYHMLGMQSSSSGNCELTRHNLFHQCAETTDCNSRSCTSTQV